MAKKIQIRRDTAANWTNTNPTLAQGEPALETDTLKEKIGDGINDWNNLPYKSSSGGFPIIMIDGRPWELRKTVNLNDPAKTLVQEVDDIIVGSPASGEFVFLKYLGGNVTDFYNENIYELITGI